MTKEGKTDAAYESLVSALIAEHPPRQDSLLVILRALQDGFGHVPDCAVPMIAEALNLSRAEVYGVVTFYHDFRRTPPAKHTLKLCRAEACQSMGGEKLAEHASRALGIAFGETSDDGQISLESVYCLGLCGCAPAALLDGNPVGRLDTPSLDALLVEVQS
jgi:formate dehydrogenase subunit gamma